MDTAEILPVELVLLGYLHLLRDLVHLRIDGRDPLVARIVEVREEGLLLTAPWDADGGQLMPVAGTFVKVGCVVEGGIQWLGAVATGSEKDNPLGFGVRYADAPIRLERRREPRAKVDFRIDLSAAAGNDTVEGALMDVSEGGLRASAAIELQVGDMVHMTVYPPDSPPMRLTASVLRAEPGGIYAFTYGLVSAGSCPQLVELAFKSAAKAA